MILSLIFIQSRKIQHLQNDTRTLMSLDVYSYFNDYNLTLPFTARKMAYSCSANQGKCLSNFAVCEDNVCRCNSLMEPTPEGRCKDPEFSVLEESCQRNDCSGGTVCEAGTCVCPQHMRRLTTEEFWIDPMMTDYCIDKDFSVRTSALNLFLYVFYGMI